MILRIQMNLEIVSPFGWFIEYIIKVIKNGTTCFNDWIRQHVAYL